VKTNGAAANHLLFGQGGTDVLAGADELQGMALA